MKCVILMMWILQGHEWKQCCGRIYCACVWELENKQRKRFEKRIYGFIFICLLLFQTSIAQHRRSCLQFKTIQLERTKALFSTPMENMTAQSHKTAFVIRQCQIFDFVITTTCLSLPTPVTHIQIHTQKHVHTHTHTCRTCFCHIGGHHVNCINSQGTQFTCLFVFWVRGMGGVH